MVNDDERAGHAHLELHDRRTAGGNNRRLDVARGRGEIAFRPHHVENLTDDVERRHEVRPAVADEEANGLADFGGSALSPTVEPTEPLNTT